jgi:hypothetical protein
MSYWTLVYLLTDVCSAPSMKDQDNLTKTKQQSIVHASSATLPRSH